MKMFVLFGQRICNYDGEFMPEPLEIAGEHTMDENPEWMEGKISEYKESCEFSSLGVIQINLDDAAEKAIDRAFNGYFIVKGSVEETE